MDVLEEDLRDDAEGDLAVDAAEGEVVDLVAEGRDVGALGRVDVEREYVVARGIEVVGELEGKGRVAAAILAEFVAVEVDGGGGHDAFEVDEDALAGGGVGDFQLAAVGGDELVVLVLKAVPRQRNIAVRDDDFGKARVVKAGLVRAFDDGRVIAPAAIDGVHGAAGGHARAFFRCGQRGLCEARARDQRSTALKEAATIHFLATHVRVTLSARAR